MNNKRVIPRDQSLPCLSYKEERAITKHFFHTDRLKNRYDLVIIFGTSSQFKECAGLVDKVIEEFKYEKIAFLGGIPDYVDSKELKKSEARLIYESVKKDIPISKLILEEESKNTKENVVFLNKIYKLDKVTSILIISNSLHLYRAYLTIRKYTVKSTLIDRVSYAYTPSQHPSMVLTKKNWISNEIFSQKVAGEFKRVKIYGKQGDLFIPEEENEIKESLNLFQ